MRNEDPGLCLRPWNSQGLGLCSWRTAQQSPMPGPQSRPVATPSPMVSTQSRLLLPPDSKLDTLPASPNFLSPALWPPGCSLLPQGNDLLRSRDHRITHKSPSSGCHRHCQKHTSFPPVGKGPDLTLSHFPLTHSHASGHTHIHTQIHSSRHTDMHRCIDKHRNTHTHTDTHTHRYTHGLRYSVPSSMESWLCSAPPMAFQAAFRGRWCLQRWPGSVRQTVLRSNTSCSTDKMCDLGQVTLLHGPASVSSSCKWEHTNCLNGFISSMKCSNLGKAVSTVPGTR